jgi:hypothetical protein
LGVEEAVIDCSARSSEVYVLSEDALQASSSGTGVLRYIKFLSATILHTCDREPGRVNRSQGVLKKMSLMKSKLRLTGAFAALLALALAASCRGFFVNPTLTGISVGPQATLNINQSIQMSATGTYSDGTQKQINSGVAWSSSDPSSVSISSGGLATGLVIGSATITGSSGSCSACTGTTTVTVTLTGVSSVVVTPSSQSVTIGGSPVFFHAQANGSTDITNPADGTTWTVTDLGGTDQTANFTLSFVGGTGTGTGEGFLPNSGVATGTYHVNATYNTIVGTATLNVQ